MNLEAYWQQCTFYKISVLLRYCLLLMSKQGDAFWSAATSESSFKYFHIEWIQMQDDKTVNYCSESVMECISGLEGREGEMQPRK